MKKVNFAVLIAVSSLLTTGCRGDEKRVYLYYPSHAEGTKLYVGVHQAKILRSGFYEFESDGKADEIGIRCEIKPGGGHFETSAVIVDTGTVVIDGMRNICYELKPYSDESRPLDSSRIIWYTDIYPKGTGDMIYKVRGGYQYIHVAWNRIKTHTIEMRFRAGLDSPYVWIKFLCYDSVFVSPETTAYLIEEPFPFTKQESFNLARRRVFKFYKGFRYYYGAFEVLPTDSAGRVRLRVSFSVVPKLGWTLPPGL